MILKDVDLGMYLVESKIPTDASSLKTVQLMLDNNVFKIAAANPDIFCQKMGWYYGIDSVVSLNPALAIVEQFLSNSQSNALKHLAKFEAAFVPLDIFPKGYSKAILQDVLRLESELRQQVGFFFCFVALLRHYYLSPVDDDILRRWTDLFSLDIPRSAFVYWIGAIFLLSRKDSKLKFHLQDFSLEKFSKNFCTFRKEEGEDYTRWLRNRVFDLLLFSLSPTLSFEKFGGIPSRVILATKDKFVGEFIGKFFAWNGETQPGNAWPLAPLLHKLDVQSDTTHEWINQLVANFPEPRGTPTAQMKISRMKVLVDFALSEISEKERYDLHLALYEFRVFEQLK